MALLDRAMCRFEAQGRVSSMKYGDASNACLVTTIMNGTHIFNMKSLCREDLGMDSSHQSLSTRDVESFPHHIVGDDPIISSCFLSSDASIAVGSAMGGITVVSRRWRSVITSYTFQEGTPVLSLEKIPQDDTLLLSSTPDGAHILDVEHATIKLSLPSPKPHVIGALALNRNCFAVANYDGKIMLYDTRQRCDPLVVLSVPDQITSVSTSDDSGAVVAGTVGGRVFILRCIECNVREQAFGTGKTRAPVRCVASCAGKVAAGDVTAKLTLIDTSENPKPTTYWTAQTILPENSQPPATDTSWSISAAVLRKDALWGALTSPESSVTHVVVLPV